MIYERSAKFREGDAVLVGSTTPGVIEKVIYNRGLGWLYTVAGMRDVEEYFLQWESFPPIQWRIWWGFVMLAEGARRKYEPQFE